MRWLVQSNLGSARDISAIRDACQRLGHTFEAIDYVPFSLSAPDVAPSDHDLFYGSPNMIRLVVEAGRWRPVQGELLERALRAASEAGLRVRAVRQRGVMLEIVPHDLEALPPIEAMRELADALAGDGIRYVTLALDDDEQTDEEGAP